MKIARYTYKNVFGFLGEQNEIITRRDTDCSVSEKEIIFVSITVDNLPIYIVLPF